MCERVTVFKSLGIMDNSSLKWNDHIDYITKRTAKRLWLTKKLKRARLSVDDLVHYHEVVMRPVLEYACPVTLALQSNQAADENGGRRPAALRTDI